MNLSPLSQQYIQATQATIYYINEQTRKWLRYYIKQIDTASVYLQDRRLAYPALIAANLVFFECARMICDITHKILSKSSWYTNLSDERRYPFLMVIFIGNIVMANWIFCRALRLPISTTGVVITSFSTCLIYLNIRLHFQKH